MLGGCDGGGESNGARSPEPRTPPKYVILISLDTLRADRLGCYGYERDTSPNIDAFASESVLFANAAAQSAQTLVSHKSLLASKYPLRIVRETTNANLARLAALKNPQRFVVNVFANMKSRQLVSDFEQAGRRTAAFTDGRWMVRALHFDKGFDDFNSDGGHMKKIVPRVRHWLNRVGKIPFFLFVHAYDAHCPYRSREPYDSLFCKDHSQHIPLAGKCGLELVEMAVSDNDIRAVNDHYDGGVASADAYTGEIFDELRRVGIYDEALIVLMSDHGESLGEHDWIGHGGLYLEQLLVPLIVKYPASWGVRPRRITQPVELVDVMPTLLDACGLAIPSDLDGRPLLPMVEGAPWDREYTIAQVTYSEDIASRTNLAKRAILYPGKKLLIHDAKTPTAEIFDLLVDPTGQTLYSGDDPEVAENMLARLYENDLGEPAGDFTSPKEAKISEELKRQLDALGYVQP